MKIFVYILAFLKNAIYGTSIYFTGALTESADVLDILALRFLLSFAVLYLLKVTKLAKIRVGLRDLCGKTERSGAIRSLLLAALFEPVLYMLFETLGVAGTSGITAGVILSLMPVSSCITEALLLGEHTTGMQKLFLGLGIVGVVIIALNTDTSSGKDSVAGIVFLLLAIAAGALYMVFSRKSSKAFSPIEITYFAAALGMIVFNAVNVVRHIVRGTLASYFAPYMSVSNMIGFVFLAVISTIVATGMNNYALARMQASTMSAFGGVSTLVTVAVGVLLGGETLHLYHLIGLSLIVLRMVGVSWIAIRRGEGGKV